MSSEQSAPRSADQPERLSMAACAAALGVDRKTLQRWRKRGAPFAGGKGGRVEADLEELRAWAARAGLDGKTGRPFGALSGAGVSADAAAEVLEATGAPVEEVAAAAAAVDDELERPGDGEGVTADLKRKLAEAELRKRVAAASKAEHELARSRGELLLATEVQQGRLARIAVVRKGLLGLPGRLSRLPGFPAGLESEARREVEALLASYSADFVPL